MIKVFCNCPACKELLEFCPEVKHINDYRPILRCTNPKCKLNKTGSCHFVLGNRTNFGEEVED